MRHARLAVSPRPPRLAPASRQRGVAAIFAAVAMLAMLSAVALAIDIGRLYTANRSLQRAANLAALDAVQVVSGCTGQGVTGTLADAQAETITSLARNGFSTSGVTTEIGMRDLSGADGSARFLPLADGDVGLSAVRVTLTQPAPSRIIPGITGSSDLLLQASAAAHQAPQASVSISPSALMLNSANSPVLNLLLGGLLGGNVNLGVVSQQGLAAAQVNLAQLALAAGVATPAGLTEIGTTLPGALNLLAAALNGTGGAVNATAAATLQQLAAQADPSRNVLLGSVLEISNAVTGEAADTLYVDALSLLMALAQSAVEGQSLNLPVNVALPAGLANLQLSLMVVQAPKIVGPGPAGLGPDGMPLTYARTAALQLRLRASVLDVGGALAGLSPLVGVVAQPIRIGLDVELGAAQASVREIQCPASNRPDTAVDLDVQTQLATVRLGTFTGAAASAPPLSGGPLINAINLPILGPVLSVALGAPASLEVGVEDEVDTSFINDFPLYVSLPTPSNPRIVGDEALLGSTGVSLSTQFSNQLTVRVLGIPLPVGEVQSVADTLLTPLFSILDTVIDPLLEQLGAQPGAASVQVLSVSVPRAEVFTTARVGAAVIP